MVWKYQALFHAKKLDRCTEELHLIITILIHKVGIEVTSSLVHQVSCAIFL